MALSTQTAREMILDRLQSSDGDDFFDTDDDDDGDGDGDGDGDDDEWDEANEENVEAVYLAVNSDPEGTLLVLQMPNEAIPNFNQMLQLQQLQLQLILIVIMQQQHMTR